MSLNGSFSNFEARYHYGQFLMRAGRQEETETLYEQIMNEMKHRSYRERRPHQEWLSRIKEEMGRMVKA